MDARITVRNQKDLDEHFELHSVECEFTLDSNNKVYRYYGHDKDIIYQVYGCPICLLAFHTTTKESRNDRAKKMLDNFANIDNNVLMYQQFIKDELKKPYPNYKFIANCCIKIELLKQEENF